MHRHADQLLAEHCPHLPPCAVTLPPLNTSMDARICKLCQKRPASIHLAQSDDPSQERPWRTLNICSICALEHNLDLQPSRPPDLDTILNPTTTSEASPTSTATNEPIEPCPLCGLDWADFEQHKRFGCAHDYTHFEDRLVGLLDQIHGSTTHRGRRLDPSKPPQQDPITERLHLNEQLRKAVVEERYEEAAHLRDQIRKLDA